MLLDHLALPARSEGRDPRLVADRARALERDVRHVPLHALALVLPWTTPTCYVVYPPGSTALTTSSSASVSPLTCSPGSAAAMGTGVACGRIGSDRWRLVEPAHLVDKLVVLSVKWCYTQPCHGIGAAMYKLVRQLGLKQLAIEEAVPLGLALVIAEVFYKFPSSPCCCLPGDVVRDQRRGLMDPRATSAPGPAVRTSDDRRAFPCLGERPGHAGTVRPLVRHRPRRRSHDPDHRSWGAHLVARVDRVLRAPDVLGELSGSELTVEPADAASRQRFVVFADGAMYGETIAVREIGRVDP